MSSKALPNTYTCYGCGHTYTQDPNQTEEDRRQESEHNFGHIAKEDQAILCDDCYEDFMKMKFLN